MAKKVLVIGGTGFLGKALVNRLIEKQYNVRLLHRKNSNLDGVNEAVEKIVGDVTDYQSLLAAYKDVDYAFHSAALVTQWTKDKSIFDRINVDGFLSSMEAAKKNKVKKVVYTSSFMALGPSNGKPFTEKDFKERSYFHNEYERTKYIAELKLKELWKKGYKISAAYPGVIYGPGDLTEGNIVVRNFILPRVQKQFLGFFLLGKGKGLWSYSYIDDVADGHIKILEKGKIGEGYILGGENADHRRLFALVQEFSGVKPPPMKLPFAVAKLRGYLDLTLARLFGKQPEVTPNAVSVFQKDWAYDSSKAVKTIGYKMTPLKEGIKKTMEWLEKNGYYKR
jgi:farnesol dehydrogenase